MTLLSEIIHGTSPLLLCRPARAKSAAFDRHKSIFADPAYPGPKPGKPAFTPGKPVDARQLRSIN